MKPDPTAYAAFLDRLHEHQGILGRICAVYADTPEDRDDLRQEILMQAWKSFPAFRGASAFSTWLYRVGLNTALMSRRRSRARHESSLDPVQEGHLVAREPDEANGDVERLYEEIRALPSLDRAIVLLALERQSHEEIAEITGLTRGNIGVRLVRIRQRLRERLTRGEPKR